MMCTPKVPPINNCTPIIITSSSKFRFDLKIEITYWMHEQEMQVHIAPCLILRNGFNGPFFRILLCKVSGYDKTQLSGTYPLSQSFLVAPKYIQWQNVLSLSELALEAHQCQCIFRDTYLFFLVLCFCF